MILKYREMKKDKMESHLENITSDCNIML